MTPTVAVVGHVEHVEFCVVDRLPRAGEIVHSTHAYSEAAGGGAVAVVQMRKLAGEATFFTALGNDDRAAAVHHDLTNHGVTVHAARRDRPHRRCFTHLDAHGERTITVIGDRILPRGDDPLPWEDLEDTDAVYLTAGDAAAVRKARQAKVLVATVRAFDALAEAAVELDALVASAADPSEQYDLAKLPAQPRAIVITEGHNGGRYKTADGTTGRWRATTPPGPTVDAYGCGDSFAAGLAFALGRGDTLDEALHLGARCGAHCLTGRGPYAAQLEPVPAQPPSARRSAS
jgi:ribokinase